MKLFKEICFATALTFAALVAPAPEAGAHEIKAGNLVIHHPWARQPMKMSEVAAGFMQIENKGTEDDRLIKATAEITPTVQIHEMKMEGDVMKMQELPDGLVIPAGKTVELKPKSFHIMFMGLKSKLMEGEEIKGTLVFEKAGTVEIDYEVTNPDAGMN